MKVLRTLILCWLCVAAVSLADNIGQAPKVLMLQVQPQSIVLSSPVHALILQSFKRVGDDVYVLSPEADADGLSDTDQQRIRQADLVVWNGPAYEPYLQSVLQDKSRTLEVMALPGLEHGSAEAAWWQEGWRIVQAWFSDHKQPQALVWLDADNAVKLAKAMAKALHYPDKSTRSFELRFQLWQLSHQQQAMDANTPVFLVYRESYRYLLSPFGLVYELVRHADSHHVDDLSKARAWVQQWLAKQPGPVPVCLVLPYGTQTLWRDAFPEQARVTLVTVDEAVEADDYTHFFDFWMQHYQQLSTCIKMADG